MSTLISHYLKFENMAVFLKTTITIQRDSFEKLALWTVGVMVPSEQF